MIIPHFNHHETERIHHHTSSVTVAMMMEHAFAVDLGDANKKIALKTWKKLVQIDGIDASN